MSKCLQHTPLHAMHLEAGARMAPFAGYNMPIQYPLGIKHEHLHCRNQAGLFDISHMGQLRLRANNMATAALALEALMPMDILTLQPGRQRYGLLTNANGGILDDLMITHANDHYFMVVNGACKLNDIAHLQASLPQSITLETLHNQALLALQGPAAVNVLEQLTPVVREMKFMQGKALSMLGTHCFISRAGYTGEDGFEISLPADKAPELVKHLLEFDAVQWIGLGARDCLRLEAGLCLYGHDLDSNTTPVAAGLSWAIQPSRRLGGDRSGGFLGSDNILTELKSGSSHCRIGLLPQGRAPIRQGSELCANNGAIIGRVTSGSFGPTLNAPVAMGYVMSQHAMVGNQVYAIVRGQQRPCKITPMPFVPHRYHRS
jgi:aminomethyltransferase